MGITHFLVADTQLYKRLCPSVCPSVRRSVMIKLESVKTRLSAPAHPSATGIGRVSGLVSFFVHFPCYSMEIIEIFIGCQFSMFYVLCSMFYVLSFLCYSMVQWCSQTQLDRNPPVFYRTSSPAGPLPC